MNACRRIGRLGWILAAMGCALLPDAPAAEVGETIESCVSPSTLRLASGDRRAVLDAADQAQVSAEMLRRYPVLARDGFAVSKIVLWEKAAGELVLITLAAHPDKPGAECFTATFNASRFERIDALVRKYLRPRSST